MENIVKLSKEINASELVNCLLDYKITVNTKVHMQYLDAKV